MAGNKFDAGKTRVDLLPQDALWAVADILTYGAEEKPRPDGGQGYGDRNWEAGIEFGKLYGAALRHLMRWYNNQNFDKESGCRHLAHAACCVLMLLHYDLQYQYYEAFDNRPDINTYSTLLGEELRHVEDSRIFKQEKEPDSPKKDS